MPNNAHIQDGSCNFHTFHTCPFCELKKEENTQGSVKACSLYNGNSIQNSIHKTADLIFRLQCPSPRGEVSSPTCSPRCEFVAASKCTQIRIYRVDIDDRWCCCSLHPQNSNVKNDRVQITIYYCTNALNSSCLGCQVVKTFLMIKNAFMQVGYSILNSDWVPVPNLQL